jgi:hypothetical protein
MASQQARHETETDLRYAALDARLSSGDDAAHAQAHLDRLIAETPAAASTVAPSIVAQGTALDALLASHTPACSAPAGGLARLRERMLPETDNDIASANASADAALASLLNREPGIAPHAGGLERFHARFGDVLNEIADEPDYEVRAIAALAPSAAPRSGGLERFKSRYATELNAEPERDAALAALLATHTPTAQPAVAGLATLKNRIARETAPILPVVQDPLSVPVGHTGRTAARTSRSNRSNRVNRVHRTRPTSAMMAAVLLAAFMVMAGTLGGNTPDGRRGVASAVSISSGLVEVATADGWRRVATGETVHTGSTLKVESNDATLQVPGANATLIATRGTTLRLASADTLACATGSINATVARQPAGSSLVFALGASDGRAPLNARIVGTRFQADVSRDGVVSLAVDEGAVEISREGFPTRMLAAGDFALAAVDAAPSVNPRALSMRATRYRAGGKIAVTFTLTSTANVALPFHGLSAGEPVFQLRVRTPSDDRPRLVNLTQYADAEWLASNAVTSLAPGESYRMRFNLPANEYDDALMEGIYTALFPRPYQQLSDLHVCPVERSD